MRIYPEDIHTAIQMALHYPHPALFRRSFARAGECCAQRTAGAGVRRGEASGVYLVASGIGLRPRTLWLGIEQTRAGNRIVVSGSLGDHGAAVLHR